MKLIPLALLAFMPLSVVFSQSNKIDKKMETAYKLVEKEKYNDAEECVEKILDENPEYGKGWDYLSKIRYKQYQIAKSTDGLFSGKVTVTTKDKDGKETKGSDSLANSLMELLNNMNPSKVAFDKYIYTLRKALLTSEDAYRASAILRNLYIDAETDTAVSKKALKYFTSAEEQFGKKNYDDAAKLYKRALEEQPDFFKASLYLGDCFYFLENYPSATDAFKEAVKIFPDLLEPRKYLIDSYNKQRLYDKCLDECIKAMTVYPDLTVQTKLDDAAYYLNKKIDYIWTPRLVFPNKIADSTKSTLNKYKPEKESSVKAPWTFYQKAKTDIAPFCNTKGIIYQANKLTATKYLELFSWEEMLKNSTDPTLDQAKKMQKDGFLDCYVLITCYHYDFYDQYIDFASKNKNKIMEYYKKYIVNK